MDWQERSDRVHPTWSSAVNSARDPDERAGTHPEK